MNYQFLCKFCDTPTRTTPSKIYMRCMCDDENRILPITYLDDIKKVFVPDNLYLLETERPFYADMEITKM